MSCVAAQMQQDRGCQVLSVEPHWSGKLRMVMWQRIGIKKVLPYNNGFKPCLASTAI